MKKLFISLIVLFTFQVSAQAQLGHTEEIMHFQEELNKDYKDPKESPLSNRQRRKFKEHKFFPISEKYRVEAKFVKELYPKPFKMKTSGTGQPVYEKYGTAIFEIDGKEYSLSIYQSHRLREKAAYKDHLFLPFTDLTSGKESYGGGRFIDLTIPKGETIVIDFNKAYNPYCAYVHGKYSCPIPPQENDLNVAVKAGIKLEKDH